MPPSDVSAAARAQQKLRRQEERIQQAEAAINPHPIDRSAQQSRPKNKSSSKLTDSTPDASGENGGVEVRINRYSAIPRDPSLSRSISSLSQRAPNMNAPVPTTSNMDRQGSVMHDTIGFQKYTRRGGRPRMIAEPGYYEGKPEGKHKTVEASYDKNETLEVFKQPLPGPDFLITSPGMADGIIQFVQHPNGDVAAHMWSAHNYEWVNIGSFSNIRKKVEGQLARERLKGETAWQKLQQNSLAYFRIVAKQREAAVMGTRFGQDNIKEALPDTRLPDTRSAEPALRTNGQSASASGAASYNAHAEDNSDTTSAQQDMTTSRRVQRMNEITLDHIMRAAPFAPHHEQFNSVTPDTVDKQDDPFSINTATQYSAFDWQTDARDLGHPNPSANIYNPTHPSMPFSVTQPSVAHPNMPYRTINNTLAQQGAHPARSNVQPSPFLFPPQIEGTKRISGGEQMPTIPSTPTARSKPVTPLDSRAALRDQLRRTVDTATQRNLTAASLPRTVMHDPVQPALPKTLCGPVQPVALGLTQAIHQPMRSRELDFFEDDWSIESSELRKSGALIERLNHIKSQLRAPRPTVSREFVQEDLTRMCHEWEDNHLAIAQPASFWVDDSAPTDLCVTEDDSPFGSTNLARYEKELNEWYSSGSKFARQEELYQRIIAAAPAPPPSSRVDSSCPDSSTPTSSAAYYHSGLTRALIPVYENLASYVEGSREQSRDYWCPWSRAPEWSIDRGPNGNNSFLDNKWGQPPARVGRDARYRRVPGDLQFGGFLPQAPVGSPSGSVGMGMGLPMSGGRYGYGGGGGRY
jgi:hypothetical protein